MHTSFPPLTPNQHTPPEHLSNTNDASTQHGLLHQDQDLERLPDVQPLNGELSSPDEPRDVWKGKGRGPKGLKGLKGKRAAGRRKDGEEDENDEIDPTQGSPLLALPYDTLVHLLAYLPPPALLALQLVNRELHVIVSDDALWRAAFAWSFLGVSPGEDARGPLVMRRLGMGSTWKEEFVKRSAAIKRWKKSRTTLLTHNPRLSTIHSISLDLPSLTSPTPTTSPKRLLSSSLSHGVISRSEPFTGKLSKGYIPAPGDSPTDATALALGRDGRVAWGFAGGEVGWLVVAKGALSQGGGGSTAGGGVWGMRGDGLTSRSTRTQAGPGTDAHTGPVAVLALPPAKVPVWAQNTFISGALDGRVKLWATDPFLRCIWTSPPLISAPSITAAPHVLATRPDAVTALAYDPGSGSIAAGFASGVARVWSGLAIGAYLDSTGSEGESAARLAHTHSMTSPAPSSEEEVPVSYVALDPHNSAPDDPRPTLLVHRKTHASFSRVSPDGKHTTLFGRGPLAELTCFSTLFDPPSPSSSSSRTSGTSTPLEGIPLTPLAEPGPAGRALRPGRWVVGGDAVGRTCVWDWDAVAEGEGEIDPVRVLDGHQSRITAVAVTPLLILTGSADGLLLAHDPLTSTLIRTFNHNSSQRHLSRYLASADARAEDAEAWAVAQIVADEQALVAAVGSKVVAWKAGDVRELKGKGRGWKGNGSARGGGQGGKYYQAASLKQEIRDSQLELDDEFARSTSRLQLARRTAAHLEEMGLSEADALEYVMMISRDEEEERRRAASIGSGPGTAPRAESAEDAELREMLEEIRLAEERERAETGAGADDSFTFAFDEDDEADAPSSPYSSALTSPRPSPSPSSPSPAAQWLASPPATFRALASNAKVQLSPRASPQIYGSSLDRGSSIPPIDLGDAAWPVVGRGTPPAASPGRMMAWGEAARRASASASGSAERTSAMAAAAAGMPRGRVEREEDEMDEALKLALDLSLAEALSRGGEV